MISLCMRFEITMMSIIETYLVQGPWHDGLEGYLSVYFVSILSISFSEMGMHLQIYTESEALPGSEKSMLNTFYDMKRKMCARISVNSDEVFT